MSLLHISFFEVSNLYSNSSIFINLSCSWFCPTATWLVEHVIISGYLGVFTSFEGRMEFGIFRIFSWVLRIFFFLKSVWYFTFILELFTHWFIIYICPHNESNFNINVRKCSILSSSVDFRGWAFDTEFGDDFISECKKIEVHKMESIHLR